MAALHEPGAAPHATICDTFYPPRAPLLQTLPACLASFETGVCRAGATCDAGRAGKSKEGAGLAMAKDSVEGARVMQASFPRQMAKG